MKKRLIIIWVLLACSAVYPSTKSRIIDWICGQEFNRTQLENVTWRQLEAMAESRGIDPNSIKPFRHTIKNAAWSDWRQRRIETARAGLEAKVREYDADAVVLYLGQERSAVDPNNMVSVFSVEVDLELER